ncbi:MAG: phosphate ABC transporter permease PstA [Endomicrobium sp.]|jgi:phosphate transport system permease protein|nr:phosphate ABC transporter permease PstA [Endomicrobium sp.]
MIKLRLNPKLSQKLSYFALLFATIIAIIPVVAIIFIIIINGISTINFEFLTSMPKNGMRSGGIFPAIVGTFAITMFTIIISLPIGIFAAIYLNEYAKDNNMFTNLIKLGIVNLATIPSIVYGLFGFYVFVVLMKFGVSIISGALTLSIMELPVIITTSCNALKNVPYSFREASWALGVSKWKTIMYIVLPNAVPSIMTGTILSIARISGETAPILFTAAVFYVPHLPKSVFDQIMTLPYHLYILSTQIPNVSNDIIFGTALVLLIMVLTISFIAIFIRIYFRKHKKW